jgi:hypothetical protein
MNTNTTTERIVQVKHPPLFLKPKSSDILFTCSMPDPDVEISFRSLDISKDIDLIHKWANKEYAKRFWKLEGTKSIVTHVYNAVLKNPHAHSFIGIVNDHPFCQIDVYALHADEVGEHVACVPEDCGMHLLMCPPREMKRGWSRAALLGFLEFYFSFPQAQRLFVEPDRQNFYANKLATSVGFIFLETIELSDKVANLYVFERNTI